MDSLWNIFTVYRLSVLFERYQSFSELVSAVVGGMVFQRGAAKQKNKWWFVQSGHYFSVPPGVFIDGAVTV